MVNIRDIEERETVKIGINYIGMISVVIGQAVVGAPVIVRVKVVIIVIAVVIMVVV